MFSSFVSVARFCQCSLPLYFSFFSFLLCLWLGSCNALCLFIYSLFFLFLCVCGSVLPKFYALLVFFFLFYYAWVSVLPMFYSSLFSVVPESWFCQCPMPLYLYFSIVLCQWHSFAKCSMPLYLYFFFCSVSVAQFCQMFYASLFLFFILCLCLCVANVLCLFNCIPSFVSVAQLCQCSMPLH